MLALVRTMPYSPFYSHLIKDTTYGISTEIFNSIKLTNRQLVYKPQSPHANFSSRHIRVPSKSMLTNTYDQAVLLA